jgi:hypothetical protein
LPWAIFDGSLREQTDAPLIDALREQTDALLIDALWEQTDALLIDALLVADGGCRDPFGIAAPRPSLDSPPP